MQKIEITETKRGDYEFSIVEDLDGYYNFRINNFGSSSPFCKIYDEAKEKLCSQCLQHLDTLYVYTINKLKEAGLLDKNFPKICCNCYNDRNNF